MKKNRVKIEDLKVDAVADLSDTDISRIAGGTTKSLPNIKHTPITIDIGIGQTAVKTEDPRLTS